MSQEPEEKKPKKVKPINIVGTVLMSLAALTVARGGCEELQGNLPCGLDPDTGVNLVIEELEGVRDANLELTPELLEAIDQRTGVKLRAEANGNSCSKSTLRRLDGQRAVAIERTGWLLERN